MRTGRQVTDENEKINTERTGVNNQDVAVPSQSVHEDEAITDDLGPGDELNRPRRGRGTRGGVRSRARGRRFGLYSPPPRRAPDTRLDEGPAPLSPPPFHDQPFRGGPMRTHQEDYTSKDRDEFGRPIGFNNRQADHTKVLDPFKPALDRRRSRSPARVDRGPIADRKPRNRRADNFGGGNIFASDPRDRADQPRYRGNLAFDARGGDADNGERRRARDFSVRRRSPGFNPRCRSRSPIVHRSDKNSHTDASRPASPRRRERSPRPSHHGRNLFSPETTRRARVRKSRREH